MSTNSRPKLRLLVRGKQKLDSLLHRRKRPRNEGDDGDMATQGEQSGFEEEIPILSRINDPSKAAAPTYGNNSVAQSNGEDEENERGRCDDDNMNEEEMKKSLRRRGITGIQELSNPPQATMTFNTSTVISGNRAVAVQPSAPFPSNLFTFSVPNRLPSFCPSRGFVLKEPKLQAARAQMHQAARNTFLKSNPTMARSSREHSGSIDQGIRNDNVVNSTDVSPGSAKSKAKGRKSSSKPTFEFLAQPMQAPTQDDPLNYLRLSAASTPPKPTVAKPRPLSKVSAFVRPEIEEPRPSPEICRDSRRCQVMPKDVFLNSTPDGNETAAFIDDTERDVKPPRLTEQGDVPALTPTNTKERIAFNTSAWSTGAKRSPHTPEKSTGQDVANTRVTTNLPHQATSRINVPTVPDTYYTAPGRLASALEFSRSQRSSSQPQGLKRKRGDANLSSTSYVHQRTNDASFNIFTNGIVLYPELVLIFASHLPVQTLINLYSISKDFHIIVNQRFSTVILNQLSVKAPCAAKCYPWRCYTDLCQPDPSFFSQTTSLGHTGEVINIRPVGPSRTPSTSPPKGIPPSHVQNIAESGLSGAISGPIKKVPTFRYLRMAIHREKVIHELYSVFAEQGVPLPGCPATYSPKPHEHSSLSANAAFATTLHKLWFLFDIPDNARRIAYIHSTLLFTNTDLLYGLAFLVKLDMVLHDPLATEKRDGTRKLLFSARDGFDTILRVLKRDTSPPSIRGSSLASELDLLRTWARYGVEVAEDGTERPIGSGLFIPSYLTLQDYLASPSLFGVPRDEVGLLNREFWGALSARSPKNRKKGPTPVISGQRAKSLLRPDQLLMRETVQRRMVMGEQFRRAMLHGYVDSETLGRIPVREYGRRSEVLEELGEYDVEEALAGGLGALKIEEGGDELLDLGEKQSDIGSELMVKRRGVGKTEIAERNKSEKNTVGMYAAWKAEVEKEKQAEKKRREMNAFQQVDSYSL